VATPDNLQIAVAVFNDIRHRYPALVMTIELEPQHVDVAMDIPRQDGLLFDIHLNLQNHDELHLVAGDGFWLEWFPCTKPSIVELYRQAVCGLIGGELRVLEYRSGSRYLRGYLQRHDGSTWRTIGRSYDRFSLPWRREEERVLQNIPAGRRE
jgi:hypothetical protein